MTRIFSGIFFIMLVGGAIVWWQTQLDESNSNAVTDVQTHQDSKTLSARSSVSDLNIDSLLLSLQDELNKLEQEILSLEKTHNNNKGELGKYNKICLDEKPKTKNKSYCNQSAEFAKNANELSTTLLDLKTNREKLERDIDALISK